jgi:hypothetical protein
MLKIFREHVVSPLLYWSQNPETYESGFPEIRNRSINTGANSLQHREDQSRVPLRGVLLIVTALIIQIAGNAR